MIFSPKDSMDIQDWYVTCHVYVQCYFLPCGCSDKTTNISL